MSGLAKIRPNHLENYAATESELSFCVAAGAAGRLDFYPSRPLDGTNYFKLLIKTSQPLKCKLLLDNENIEFFVGAGSETQEFRMILALQSAMMAGRKTYGIQIEPPGGNGAAEIGVYSIDFSAISDIPDMAFIENGIVKAGAKMTWGGGICWFESLRDNVQQVVLDDGRVHIGPDYGSKPGARLVSSNVNLLNSHDTGRLVQQSYYGIREEPYKQVIYNKVPWPWNPVQGGDVRNNSSRIVDYDNDGTSMYIKCRPLDWSQVNTPTDSYMESWISLDGGLLRVKARFTDFSGYRHPKTSQELPALYFGAPLHRYVCYTGDKPFTNDPAYRIEENWPDYWKIGEHERGFKATEKWSAWVNDDGWGAGVFSPEITGHIISRFGDPIFEGESYLADPTTYISPVGEVELKPYEPFEYAYCLAAGTLEEMRAMFYREIER